jgi:carboxyl-terminal processing protease
MAVRFLQSAALAATLLGIALATPLPAQVVTLAPPVPATDDLAVVFEHGSKLERERRWAEALSHYEEALRHHPARTELKQRVITARAHYDVCRRYSDQSYLTALNTISERDAIAIYDEVLLKLHSHYVQQPQWQHVLNCGMTNLEVAITESAFVERNLPQMPIEQLAALQRQVRELSQSRKVADRRQACDLVQSLATNLQQRFGLPASVAIFEFTSGAAAALDEYSGFLTGGQMDEIFSQIEGNFVGLGVELKTETDGLLIVNVIPGGPADVGGIKPRDRIISVDGKTPADVSSDALADMLRGAEGSQVEVVARGVDQTSRAMRLTRRRVEVPSVENVKIVDAQSGVAYFKLTSFQKTTSRDVDAALWKLHGEGMQSLIIDLRGNPGGLLKAAVDVADRFVNEGLIVATRGRSPREDFDHQGERAGTWRVPLVVLIDHDSASASEILAGAIRDHKRGTVVGEKSYGKGSVQGIFPLTAGNVGIRLTTAKWYTPSGQAISGQGVAPDITVQVAAKPVNGAVASQPDLILQAGLQAATSQLATRQAAK